MASPQYHYEQAERLLAYGVEVVEKIEAADSMFDGPLPKPHDADARIRARRDDLGKQAMGIWAQAQVHATLATIPLRQVEVTYAGEVGR